MEADIRFSLFKELPRILVPIPGRDEEVKLDLLTLNDFIYEFQISYDATHVPCSDPVEEERRLVARDESLTAEFKAFILPQLGMPSHLVPDMAVNRMMDLVIQKTSEYLKERREIEESKKNSSSTASLPAYTPEFQTISANGTHGSSPPGYSISEP